MILVIENFNYFGPNLKPKFIFSPAVATQFTGGCSCRGSRGQASVGKTYDLIIAYQFLSSSPRMIHINVYW